MWRAQPSARVFWQVARAAQRTSFYVVASCGLLPRTTRPGPRLRTAFWSVASLPLRDTRQSWPWSASALDVDEHGADATSPGCALLPRIEAKYSVPYVSGPPQAACHPEPAKDPRPQALEATSCGAFDFACRLAS